MIRSLLVCLPESWEQWAVVLARLRLEPEALQRLRHRLETGDPVLAAAGAPAELRHLVAESMCGTWFATNGLTDIVHSVSGTKPGNPLAGCLFNFIAAEVWAAIRIRLTAAGLDSVLQWSGARTLSAGTPAEPPQQITATDASYLDDGIVMLQGAANDIVRQAAEATAITTEELDGAGSLCQL